MISDDRSTIIAPIRGQFARTWAACRRTLLLLALVPTGIARAVMTVLREFFTSTAGAIASPPGPNPRLRAALAWPLRRVGQLLAPADDTFRRLDAVLARML